MTDRSAWMRRYADFQGQVQQLVASDIHEHGRPHEEREHTFRDLKQRAVEMGGLAFELYIEACALEGLRGSLLIRKATSLDATTTNMSADIEWADRDPNEDN